MITGFKIFANVRDFRWQKAYVDYTLFFSRAQLYMKISSCSSMKRLHCRATEQAVFSSHLTDPKLTPVCWSPVQLARRKCKDFTFCHLHHDFSSLSTSHPNLMTDLCICAPHVIKCSYSFNLCPRWEETSMYEIMKNYWNIIQ